MLEISLWPPHASLSTLRSHNMDCTMLPLKLIVFEDWNTSLTKLKYMDLDEIFRISTK